jgi:hypothetical protein
MNTKSLFIAALVIVSSVVSAVGKDEPTSKAGLAVVPVKGSEVFKVIYKGEAAGKVRLNLYNSANQVVFTESLTSAEGFIRPLNFRGLAYGTYTLEIVDAIGKRTEKIVYTSSKSVIHIAKLANQEGKFLLSVSNPTSSTVSVKIYNSDGNIIHSEVKNDVTTAFAQVYKITAVGSVTFEVSDLNGNYEVARY